MAAPDAKVFSARELSGDINGTLNATGDYRQDVFKALLVSERDNTKRDYYLVLGFDLPHHFLWIAYLLMRFKPDRWGGDVIIAPGYDEIQEEEREHGPLGAMVDKVLSDKDK